MKKLFCLILTLIMILTISSVCFAEETTIVDGENPEAGRTVNTVTYSREQTEFDTNTEVSPGLIEVSDQEVPLALPDTGGIPAEAFYVAGALFVVAALILALKKNKAEQKS